MASRLITPTLEERLKSYPLYSQDGKGKDAVCVAIFFIGHVRWFVLEGQQEGNDTTLFTIVCGLHETEYGYTSRQKEMESVRVEWLQIWSGRDISSGAVGRLQAGETEEHSRRGFTDFPE